MKRCTNIHLFEVYIQTSANCPLTTELLYAIQCLKLRVRPASQATQQT
jgi:hypothetical protein